MYNFVLKREKLTCCDATLGLYLDSNYFIGWNVITCKRKMYFKVPSKVCPYNILKLLWTKI